MPSFTCDELTTAAGTDLGHSRWIEIDRAHIDAFAEITEDHQWIHVDPERAMQSSFGSTIVHGNPTLSLVPVESRVRGHGEIVDVSPVSTGLHSGHISEATTNRTATARKSIRFIRKAAGSIPMLTGTPGACRWNRRARWSRTTSHPAVGVRPRLLQPGRTPVCDQASRRSMMVTLAVPPPSQMVSSP
ncbi:hypothetical protein M1M07_17015 [Rhodococcus sp. HM1]|uniref:MaoC/PaaZ C-terminal domain-containing protein n=1 Tax=Rhodococcus sp. HM1 TaxID=2937759 RepID=UPI00200A2A61|nr:MaoC/PaaZ C-terminal domain-containing protein [Rhodococcus sp. HM1]MCK8672799.1 hypothetical protein [Rhodococcus sp. HM1]